METLLFCYRLCLGYIGCLLWVMSTTYVRVVCLDICCERVGCGWYAPFCLVCFGFVWPMVCCVVLELVTH